MNSYLFENHFREIRYRVIYILVSLLFSILIIYFNIYDLLYYLTYKYTDFVIFTNITESFFVQIKLSVIFGMLLTIPIVYLQAWFFAKPGLYKKESILIRNLLTVSFFSYLIVLIGLIYVLYPLAIRFFMDFQLLDSSRLFKLVLLPKLDNVVSFYTNSLLIFIIVSQIPIISYLLIIFNILRLPLLVRYRKIFLFISFLLGAVFSPPDVLSQLFVASIFILLYELTIVYTLYIYKKTSMQTSALKS